MRLKDKVAIVTGAGSGFGEGIARKFVAEGAKVLLVDLRGDAAEQAAAALAGENIARAWRADVTSATDTKQMFDAAERFFGPLDILVNNAGIGHKPQPLEGLDEHDFDRIVAVNMKSIYLAMREAVPRFKTRATDAKGIRGVVLNIASTAGVSPRPPRGPGRPHPPSRGGQRGPRGRGPTVEGARPGRGVRPTAPRGRPRGRRGHGGHLHRRGPDPGRPPRRAGPL